MEQYHWLKDVALQVPSLVIFALYAYRTSERVSAALDRNSLIIGRVLQVLNLDDDGEKTKQKEVKNAA